MIIPLITHGRICMKRIVITLVAALVFPALGQISFSTQQKEIIKTQRERIRDQVAKYYDIVQKIDDLRASGNNDEVPELLKQLAQTQDKMQQRLQNMSKVQEKFLEHLLQVDNVLEELEPEIENTLVNLQPLASNTAYVKNPEIDKFERYVNQFNVKANMLKNLAVMAQIRYEVESALLRMKPYSKIKEEQFLSEVLTGPRHAVGHLYGRVFNTSNVNLPIMPTQYEMREMRAMSAPTEMKEPYDEIKMFVKIQTEQFAEGLDDNCKIAYGAVAGELGMWNPLASHSRFISTPTFETLSCKVEHAISKVDDIMLTETEKTQCLNVYKDFLHNLFAELQNEYGHVVTQPEGAVAALRSRDDAKAVKAVCEGLVWGLDDGISVISPEAQQIRQKRWEQHRINVRRAYLERQRDQMETGK